MNTTLEKSVEINAPRPASSAFALHRCNRLSNVLAALKLRQPDGETSGRAVEVSAEAQQGRPAAPHYLSLR
ncbi:MAG: hypothetical protein K8U03_09420 [Planctomycetia bacterium]|nr:hypothetical protein [Planctomycetia bacterium]